MRILGCLDGTNAEQICYATQMFTTAEPLTIALLTVIDVGPREGIDRMRERFWRPPMHRQPVADEMQTAESAAAQEILDAALAFLKSATETPAGTGKSAETTQSIETLVRRGRPELEIVLTAADWKADVIVIASRAEFGEPPHIGPHSVGHVARFVLDHAPCPVLLLRPLVREQFPLKR